MIHWGVATVLVIVALLLGLVVKELWLFFAVDDSKSESDEIADKAFKLAEDLQKKLETIKVRMHDVQQKYLMCQDEKLNWQHRYDALVIEKNVLETKVKALESK